MKIDLIKLQEQIDLDNVNIQKHPNFDLFLAKYSKHCVYSSNWNDITLMTRGLVYDKEGNVIINCMNKFGNYNDVIGSSCLERNKNSPYTVYDKRDGSLFQAALWNGNLITTSSGSFQSPQALKGTAMLLSKGWILEEGKSYIFELIYPNNKIIVDYKDEESLTLLAIRDTNTGKELPLEIDKFPCVKSFDITIEEVLNDLPRNDYLNKEGYVVKFLDSGERVKFKYLEYMRLHKLISGISSKWVYECLKDGVNPFESLKDIPDELVQFITKTKDEMISQYNEISFEANRIYGIVYKLSTRKEQAALIMKEYKSYANLVFSLLDGKVPDKAIWDRISYNKTDEQNFVFGRGEA